MPGLFRTDPDEPAGGKPGLYPHLLSVAGYAVLERAAGERYLSIADWLRDFYAWPEERRRAWQRDRLLGVLDHATRHVPFYRDQLAGQDLADIRLEDLPVVDKEPIKADENAFYSEGWESMPHIRKKTGGSTGVPLRYALDRRAWAHIYAAALHFRERTGFRYGERVVLLGAPTSMGLEGQNWKSRLRHRIERHNLALTGFEIGREASADRVRRADRVGAALWYGYAGTIAAMAEAVLEEEIDVVGPRAIVTTAEVLQPHWRGWIERAFGAQRLYDEYGCNDGGILSQSCGAGRFHLAENVSIVEILDADGRACPAGAEGDVAVTNLHARVLPFIRYKIGDRAVWGDGPCPCGTPGWTLERVVGRAGDHVRLPGGSEVTARTFAHVFKDTPSVRLWQVVQPDPGTIRVRVDVGAGFDDKQTGLIRDYIHRHCGDDVRVEITTDEPIDRTAGGKYRVVIREFEDPDRSEQVSSA